MKTEPFEITIDTQKNANVSFFPAGRIVRGKFDARREGPGASSAQSKWRDPIEGQVIGFDFETQTGYIVEPLHESKYDLLRDQLKKMGLSIASRFTPPPA